jgi:quercetin dioxygenase-like cupin family protein
MSDSTDVFVLADSLEYEDVGGGVKRKLLCYDKEMMMLSVLFEPGAVGALHSHPHRQVAYVKSGAFDLTISGRTQRLKAGDTYIVPANAIHGAVCIEAGELIDVFTPWREDFLN